MPQRRRPIGRWVAHMQVPLSAEDAGRLDAARADQVTPLLRVPAGLKVKVDEIDCSECLSGIGRCSGGDPEKPCRLHR